MVFFFFSLLQLEEILIFVQNKLTYLLKSKV